MLGIRRFGSVAIDLWCGDVDDFYCPHTTTSAVLDFSQIPDGLSHVAMTAFATEASIDPEEFFSSLKASLGAAPAECRIRRVTIVADDLLRYQRLLEIFYRYFTEPPLAEFLNAPE